jgi:sugar-phosphatase
LDPGPFVNSHGRPTAEKIAELAPGLDVEAEAAAVEEHETRDTDGLVALPGAVELFDFEPPVAVVTSGTRSLATARLTAVGLPIPDVLITADVVANGKPHPEPYLLAAARLDLVPSDCVVLEDAPAGVEAGKAAGMWVVAVTTTFPASELGGADQVVPDVAAYLVSLGAGE